LEILPQPFIEYFGKLPVVVGPRRRKGSVAVPPVLSVMMPLGTCAAADPTMLWMLKVDSYAEWNLCKICSSPSVKMDKKRCSHTSTSLLLK
jgi:hypothetical protein